MSAILHIAEKGNGPGEILKPLALEGVRVIESSGLDLQEQLDAVGDGIDAAVIASSVGSPLSVARTVHRSSPDTHIVFITDDEHEAGLRRELTFAPRIGSYWSVVKSDGLEAAAGVIRSAVENSARRRQFRTTLDRMNLSLAKPRVESSRLPVITDEFIATVFDQLTDGVIMCDLSGVVIAANATATQLFGRDILRGVPLDEVLDQLPEPHGTLTEMRIRRSDGVHLTVETSVEQVRDSSGKPGGSAVVVRDITERVLREERRRLLADASARLSESLDMNASLQAFASTIVASLADICVVDLVEGEGMVRVAVAAGEQSDPAIVERFRRFAPAPARVEHPSVSSVRERDLVVRNRIPAEQWAAMTTNPEHLELVRALRLHSLVSAPIPVGEQIAGAIVFVRGHREEPFSEEDVELIRELAARAGNALHHAWLYHAADQANRAKDAFLATLSHELRTPMTSILGWIQILRMEGRDQEALDEGLGVIEKSARAQAQLIEDLLDLSRIDMGKLHMEMHEIDLGDVAHAAVDTIAPAARAKDIRLSTSIAPDVVVSGDANRMQQVVWNLLSNAVKFTPRGGTVALTVDSAGSRARILVRDTGKGIDPAFLPMVFERFQQADSATTRRFGGLGLGLSIVRQLVELHGGSVHAQSEGEGKGATFVVNLPIPAIRETDRGRGAAGAESATPRDLLAKVCVLIVEDDPASANMMATLLSRVGADVELCDSVSGALDLLRIRRPHVLISDIAMPDEDGFDLIRQVRNRLRIPPERLPALALTAFGDMETKVAVLGAGFQRHLQKPANVDDILANVVELVKSRRSDPSILP